MQTQIPQLVQNDNWAIYQTFCNPKQHVIFNYFEIKLEQTHIIRFPSVELVNMANINMPEVLTCVNGVCFVKYTHKTYFSGADSLNSPAFE